MSVTTYLFPGQPPTPADYEATQRALLPRKSFHFNFDRLRKQEPSQALPIKLTTTKVCGPNPIAKLSQGVLLTQSKLSEDISPLSAQIEAMAVDAIELELRQAVHDEQQDDDLLLPHSLQNLPFDQQHEYKQRMQMHQAFALSYNEHYKHI